MALQCWMMKLLPTGLQTVTQKHGNETKGMKERITELMLQFSNWIHARCANSFAASCHGHACVHYKPASRSHPGMISVTGFFTQQITNFSMFYLFSLVLLELIVSFTL